MVNLVLFDLANCDLIKRRPLHKPLNDRGSFDQKSVDQNCVFSVDQNFHNQLTEILDGFQLIETFNNEFDQTPKI